MNHTPGPWKWGEPPGYPEEGSLACQREMLCSGADVILRATYGDSSLELATEADAHLIAAAPDLYEALERFVNMESGRPVSLTGNNVEAFQEVFEQARAALAKARGET